MFSRKIKIAIASAGILLLAGCGGAATAATTHTAPTATAPVASKTHLSQQQIASGNAIKALARDNKARAKFETYWALVNWNDVTVSSLTALGRFTNSLQNQEGPQLFQAENNLVGLTMAYFL